MYSEIRLRFKVNGRVDRVAVEPSNGVAQGCPLSPCLYLLCIQGLISLLNTDAKRAGGIRGILMPRTREGATSPAPTVMISAFADDVRVFLQDSSQLTRFRQLLDTYCDGAHVAASGVTRPRLPPSRPIAQQPQPCSHSPQPHLPPRSPRSHTPTGQCLLHMPPTTAQPRRPRRVGRVPTPWKNFSRSTPTLETL